MSETLQDEIKQGKPFQSLAEEAGLSLARTASVMLETKERFLKPHGLTPLQYNVLRILRGAGPYGLGRNEIRERLLTRMPDVTRLLTRLEEAGLICREQSAHDRRYFPTRLTPQGLDLVNRLDAPISAGQGLPFTGLSDTDLGHLIRMLAQIRSTLKAAQPMVAELPELAG